MLLLNKFEESCHIWSTKMIDCFQSREHGLVVDSLEMIFANILSRDKKLEMSRKIYINLLETIDTYKHCGSEVKLVEKLSDKDVNLKNLSHILPLNIPQNIDEPLKMSM